MQKIREVFVILEDTPGSFAHITRLLKKNRISIFGIGLFIDSARLHLSHPDKAISVLTENDFQAELHDVLSIKLPNREGALAEVTQKLKNAEINIKYLYGALEEDQKRGTIVLEVDNPKLALEIFKNHKY